jgi:hypothetical protein
MAATQTMLSTTAYGVPSGNYDGSSAEWFSDAVKAADYYRGRGGLQTINFNLSGFEGRIFLEATLNSDAPTANWFTTYELGDGSTIPVTNIVSQTVLGNFTWMRLKITGFEGGTINSVTITY